VDSAVAELGPNAAGLAADLADPATPAALVEAATQRFGRLDGALLSVGGPPAGGPLAVTEEQWQTAFQSVFLGAVRAARTVAGSLDAGGAIALVLSSSARSPVPNLAISNGLRPGLAMVAKDLADHLGPRGIRVLSLLPGRISTDRSVELFAAAPDPERARTQAEAGIPLRRMGEPAEFGRVAAFVLSPAASYLTGIALAVDGGALRTL
jgi:3-oxoacyl-[acyl-carrier protein] reductase